MVSTYTPNKNLERPGNGDYVDTWNIPVNADMTGIDTAFGGTLNLNATAGNAVLSASQYQNLILNITGAMSASVTYTIPSGVGGQWIVRNATTDSSGGPWSVTIASGGGGSSVTAIRGRNITVWSDGTNIRVAEPNISSIGTVTSVDVSGGTTGLTTSGGPVTTSGTITIAGTLAPSNGGTGITSLGTGVATWLGTPSSANLAAAVTDETGTGSLVFANAPSLTSPVLTTPDLGTPSAGVLTNATGLPIVGGTTGTLTVARGGTGATSLTANNVLLGNGTSAVQVVAPSTSGNVLTSDGTTWTSAAIPAVLPSQTGNAGKVLGTNGTSASWGTALNLGTASSPSAVTFVDFTGIPTWVKRITIMFYRYSLSGTDTTLIQLGTAGGLQTTGYASSMALFAGNAMDSQIAPTSGFGIWTNASGNAMSGQMVITNINSNSWVSSHTLGTGAGTYYGMWGGGSVNLSGAITQLRIKTETTNTFTAGTINIIWE